MQSCLAARKIATNTLSHRCTVDFHVVRYGLAHGKAVRLFPMHQYCPLTSGLHEEASLEGVGSLWEPRTVGPATHSK